MLKSMVKKAVRRTPGLRRFARGGATAAADSPPAPTRFGAESPVARPTEGAAPRVAATPSPPSSPSRPADGDRAASETSDTAPQDTAADGGSTTAPAGADAGGGPKKSGRKRAAKKKKAAARKPAGGRDAAEVEALRAEAERKKAEIRARKQQSAAPSTTAGGLTGIAALIAQSGGNVDELAAARGEQGGGVRATSGIEWAPEDTEIHVAEDGEKYWGAIDNESSRAYARGETLIIDQWECINCGTCVENTEHVFVLPDDAKAVVISQEGPMDLIQDAIDACPVTCIHWTDKPEQFEQLNDAQGAPLT